VTVGLDRIIHYGDYNWPSHHTHRAMESPCGDSDNGASRHETSATQTIEGCSLLVIRNHQYLLVFIHRVLVIGRVDLL
jgi:hypothetical protein